jgi:hypothetical protein
LPDDPVTLCRKNDLCGGRLPWCHSSAKREAPPRRRPQMAVRRCPYGKRKGA